uniref:Uncharacterized protein n=1 Tax=Plectus sambesii TaxID=2011161 RepID=A0A914UKL2_9BILA
MKFDEILTNYLGDFGAYQRKIYVLVCLPAIWCSMNMFCWTFTGADIPHRCKLDADDVDFHAHRNTTYQMNNNETDPQLQKCSRIHVATGEWQGCVDGYVFDNSEKAASAVQDWELVCDQRWVAACVQSLFYLGIFFGSLTLGYLADKVGRKLVILVGSFLITCLSIACVLSPNIIVFALFRFAHGFLEPALWQQEESAAAADEGSKKTRTYGYMDLIRSPNMRRKTLVCCYCWTIVTLIYYGISLNPSAIAGDFYVSFILTGFVEVPALILLLLLLNKLGRKFLQSGGFMLCGLAFFIIVLVPAEFEPITLILVLISKSAVTAAFCVIYLHTSEIFPTVVRGIALGLTVTCSRIGGIMSPIASMFLTDTYRGAVLTAFGAFAVVAALVTLTLPETTNKKLPETLEDGENFGKEMTLWGSAKKRNMETSKNPEEDLKMVKS